MRNKLLKRRIAVKIFPLLLSVIFIRIRGVVTESDIFRRLWYKQLFAVWDRPHCKWHIWIFSCVFGFGGDSCYVC
jgi:hypothetical protein